MASLEWGFALGRVSYCLDKRKTPRAEKREGFSIGRSERIRTSGPRLPKTVLYQAELHSGIVSIALFGGASGCRPRRRGALYSSLIWGLQAKKLKKYVGLKITVEQGVKVLPLPCFSEGVKTNAPAPHRGCGGVGC